MLRFLADENFKRVFLNGLRKDLAVDVVRVQDVGLSATDDRVILDWAARENRVLLTHDAATMTRYAYERVRAGKAMPGVLEVRFHAPIGRVIEDLLLIAACSREGELEGQILYVPL